MSFDNHRATWYTVPYQKNAWFTDTPSISRANSYLTKIKQIIKETGVTGVDVRTTKNLVIVSGPIDAVKSILGEDFDVMTLSHNDELYYESVKRSATKFSPSGKSGSQLFIKNEEGNYSLWTPPSEKHSKEYSYTAPTKHIGNHIVRNLNLSGVARVRLRELTVFATLDALTKLDKECQSLNLKLSKERMPVRRYRSKDTSYKAPNIRRPKKGLSAPELYWYEDTEMNLILLHSLAGYDYHSASGVTVYLKGPCDNLSPYRLSHALAEHGRRDGILLIPFNLGLLHWVGLELIYSHGVLVSANYYDPMGNKVPEFLNTMLAEIGHGTASWTEVQDERLIRQKNGSDCGPCTIENLLAAIGHREPESTIAGRRKRHLDLLRLAEPEFYAHFSIRQAVNKPSLSKIEHSKKVAPPAGKLMDGNEYCEASVDFLPDLTSTCGSEDEEDYLFDISDKQTMSTEILPPSAKRPRLESCAESSNEGSEEIPLPLPCIPTPLSPSPSPISNALPPPPAWPFVSPASSLSLYGIFPILPSPPLDGDISGVGFKRPRED